MDVKEALYKADNLRMQAVMAAAECQELSERVVTAELTYHMPDSPHVVNTFTWQKDDRFDAGDKIVEDLTSAKEKFEISEDAGDISSIFNQAMAFYQASVKQAWVHVDRLKRTSDHFVIPLHRSGVNFQAHVIDGVPFPELRKFLNFWRNEIDGPLNYVEVSHTSAIKDHSRATYSQGKQALIM